MRRRLGVIVVAAIASAALAGDHGARAEARPPLHVLFVGNSLTTTNDLPAVVAGLARATGRSLEYRTIAFGGYALEDHWAQGDARAELASRTWDVVVMQQGPSALPESQINLREWASRFADEARAAGTRPALLTVWPESYRRGALRDVIASYRRAAAAARADLFPAGLAPGAASLRSACTGRTGSIQALSARTPPRSSSTGGFSKRRSSASGRSRRCASGANSGPPSEGRSELPGAPGSSALP
jgi:hypothetical protein